MADWTNARGGTAEARADIEALFRLTYPRIADTRTSAISDALDVAAWFDVAAGTFGRDRPMAIVHMAAHRLVYAPADGKGSTRGGAETSSSNERGGRGYTPPKTDNAGDAILAETPGGRAYLALRRRQLAAAPSMA